MNDEADIWALNTLVQRAIAPTSDLQLNTEQIHNYFTRLVRVAHLPEAYDDLCWQAGEWLLLMSEQADDDFAKFGYEIISRALVASITHATLPSGLGWYVQKFQGGIGGDLMLGVITHPLVESRLRKCIAQQPLTLDLSRLPPDDEKLAHATLQFVACAHHFGVEDRVQLMLLARLLLHLGQSNPARAQVISRLLHKLVQCEHYIAAFYWLQAYEPDGDEDLSSLTFTVISAIVDHCLFIKQEGYQILGRLINTPQLFQIVFESEPSQLLLCLVILWLRCKHNVAFKRDIIDLAVPLLWREYPSLSQFTRIIWSWAVERESDYGYSRTTLLEYLAAPGERSRHLEEMRSQLELKPSFRLRQLPAEIWTECREKYFYTNIEVLEAISKPPILPGQFHTRLERLRLCHSAIEGVDIERLVRTSDAYEKEPARSRQTITGDIKNMLIKNLEGHRAHLLEFVDLCVHSIIAWSLIAEIESESDWFTIERECAALSDDWPALERYVDEYFLPLIEACKECAEEARYGEH